MHEFDKTVTTVIIFSHTTLIHHFSPNMSAAEMYRVLLMCAIWIGPESHPNIYVSTRNSKNVQHRNILSHECFIVQIHASLWVSVFVYHKVHALAACCFVVPSAGLQGPLPGSEEMPFYRDSKTVNWQKCMCSFTMVQFQHQVQSISFSYCYPASWYIESQPFGKHKM